MLPALQVWITSLAQCPPLHLVLQPCNVGAAPLTCATAPSCSRTTGGPVVRRTIALFFVMFPTPSALLGADIKDVQELLDPVGLQETRRHVSLLGFVLCYKEASMHCPAGKQAAQLLCRKAVLAMTRSFFAEVGPISCQV